MQPRDGQFPKSPAITKRAFQGQRKKRLIIQVATKVFAEKGFNQATISQIASKANIAEGSIYDYFKSKGRFADSACRKVELHPNLRQETRGPLGYYLSLDRGS
jgi:AcrR family transcriptional regulator